MDPIRNEGEPIRTSMNEGAPALADESRELYGDVAVTTRRRGARMVWSPGHSELRVNTTLFPNEDQAQMAIIRQVASHMGLTQALGADANLLLENTRRYPEATEPVLRWQGLAQLRESNPDIARSPTTPQNQTFTQEFQWAIDTYVLTGNYPDQLSDPVRQAIGKIPQSKGRSLIDYIASGRYLRFDGENFLSHIKPLIDELSLTDQQSGQSRKFEYQPAQTLDVASNKEPIEESDITVRVTPFYGGYYREGVCRYDPGTRQIVREAGIKQTWQVDDPPDSEAIWRTRRTYEGVIQQGKESIIKLPYGTLPLISTLNPPGTFQFMRDNLGMIYLDLRTPGQSAELTTFSFDFIQAETVSNELNIRPTERDLSPVGGALDPETQIFLDDLSAQTWMDDEQKGREIARYIRKKVRYPQNESEIGKIDALYLSVTAQELWTKITETGIAHCYWANIFRDELCKRLGVASRIVTGPYIQSKDPRFEFAIVEAAGLDKHAWGEVWSPTKQRWTHKGMDATPPKAKDDLEESDHESTEPLEGDFGESLIEEPELSQDEVERLYQKLTQQDTRTQQQPTPEQLAAKQFEQETGISWQEWYQLETWINGVNQTPVPAESSIRHRPSTLYQEWRDLFELLYKRREIPHEQYKGPVRQSEGEFLDDPVTAYIDIRSHDDDPSGYLISHQKQREKIEVSVFEDDFILDISGSMSGQPAEEQRRMVLSSEYNIRNLNERLGHSKYRTHMTTPLAVRSRVAVFGDWTNVVQESTSTISERDLCQLDRVLRAHNQSSTGLLISLQQYQASLDQETLRKISEGHHTKVLTIVSDGDVTSQAECSAIIEELRAAGIIIQGIGFGTSAQDIRVVCHDPADPEAAVVIDDVRQATLARHKMLIKHLAKL